MAILPTDGCTIDSVTLSTEQKNVINQVTAGNAFVNPDEASVQGASASLSSTLTLISGAVATGIFSTLTTALNTLNGNLTSYLNHSNRLSGVVLGATGPSGEPGIAGLLGIAKSYNSICESLTGGTKDNFSSIFNSILGPGSFKLDRTRDILTNEVKNFVQINRSLSESNGTFNAELSTHVTTVNSLSTDISVMITTDNSAFETATNTVINYNVGNALITGSSDPCFTGKLIDKIASGSMKEKLNGLL